MHMLPMPSSCIEFTHMEETTLLYVVVSHLPQTFFFPPVQETQIRPLGSERCPGGGNSNPLQYSCLEYWRSLVGYSP